MSKEEGQGELLRVPATSECPYLLTVYVSTSMTASWEKRSWGIIAPIFGYNYSHSKNFCLQL